MQNLRENSFEIKQNLNWSENARINLPTVMAEWLFNSELPSLKESEMSKYRFFKLFPFLFYHCRFYWWFKRYLRHVVYNYIKHDSVTCSLTLRHVTENCYEKCPVHFFRLNIFHSLSYEQNCLTNRTEGKLMNIKKIKLFTIKAKHILVNVRHWICCQMWGKIHALEDIK